MQGLGNAGELGLRRMFSVVVVVGGLGFEDWSIGGLEGWGVCGELCVSIDMCLCPALLLFGL